MKRAPFLFVVALFLLPFAAGCGADGGGEEDGDADLADTADATDGRVDQDQPDAPPDTVPDGTDTLPDTFPDGTDAPPDTFPDGTDVPPDAAGCMGDEECTSEEFCEFLAGTCIGPGTCIPRGTGMCPDVYAPVCGCDDVTYSNDCERQHAGVSLRHTGECGAAVCTLGDPTLLCADGEFCEGPPGSCGSDVPGWCEPVPGACPEYYAPVCGCDGITYDNDCFRQQAATWLAHDGECGTSICYQGDPDGICTDREFCEGPGGSCSADVPGWCAPRPLGCPDYWDPVCGCDGLTYGNDCERQVAGVWLDHRGECMTSICFQYDPVGVCDAATEFCEGPPGSCSDAAAGWCAPRPLGCPDVYDPVCGCDGVTYGNDCERQVAGVWLFYRGECSSLACYEGDPTDVCGRGEFCEGHEGVCGSGVAGYCTILPMVCPGIWDPVCGCDGVTYTNDCLRQVATVWLDHRGACLTPPPACSPDGVPCRDGQFCEYPPGDCGTGGIAGVCTNIPHICPLYFDPVCGCDGVTYDNDCFRAAAGVSQLHAGACGP